jgi:predicted acylesterase/phospholipase RssA
MRLSLSIGLQISGKTIMNNRDASFRILSLDGGGAKGVYTLGILREIEALSGRKLFEEFDLIYGTSTGAIIAALLALGQTVEQVTQSYFDIVPDVMGKNSRGAKSRSLEAHAHDLLGEQTFENFLTDIGIVATNYELAKPMVFKKSVRQSFSMAATFKPGFGCTIADALRASAAAFPYFEKVRVTTENQGDVVLIDGGFIANNPTLLAIADAVHAYKIDKGNIKVLSLGTGVFKEPKPPVLQRILGRFAHYQLVLRILEANSNTIEQLRLLLFRDIETVRINDTFTQDEYAANLLTSDIATLRKLNALGRHSFSKCEPDLKAKFGW